MQVHFSTIRGMMSLLEGLVDTDGPGVRTIANAFSFGGFAVNGANSNTKNLTLDGVNEVGTSGASSFVSPSVDAIAEVRVISNGGEAEFGRNDGGTVNMILKSGSREFHGTAIWNHRDEDLNANSFINNRSDIVRPITNVNEFRVAKGKNNYEFYRAGADSAYFRTSALDPPTLAPNPTGGSLATGLYEDYLPNMTFSGGAVVNPASFSNLGSGFSAPSIDPTSRTALPMTSLG